jgi:hypothetical protein
LNDGVQLNLQHGLYLKLGLCKRKVIGTIIPCQIFYQPLLCRRKNTHKCADSHKAMHQHGKKKGIYLHQHPQKRNIILNNEESSKGFDSL